MYTPVNDAMDLKDYEGKKVELVGQVSDKPWQHLVGFFPDYPESEYFDVGDFQIVIYSKKHIECTDMVQVRGTVVKLSAPPKGPSKTGSDYHEYHLLVDEYVCR